MMSLFALEGREGRSGTKRQNGAGKAFLVDDLKLFFRKKAPENGGKGSCPRNAKKAPQGNDVRVTIRKRRGETFVGVPETERPSSSVNRGPGRSRNPVCC